MPNCSIVHLPGVRDRLRSLATRLLVYVLLVGVGLTAVLAAMNVARDYRAQRSELRTVLGSIERSYTPAIAKAVFEYDVDQLEILLEGIVLLRNLEYARVVEHLPSGESTLADRGTPPTENAIEHNYPLNVRFEGEDRAVGQLEVLASRAGLRSAVVERLGALVLASGLQIFAVALVIWLIMQRAVVKHLLHIASYVRAVQLPRIDGRPLSLDRRNPPDEISNIANAINETNERLTETHRRLSETLEEKNTLLQELYHRTKNNMQTIASMIDIKAAAIGEDARIRSFAVELRTRIQAMALVHDRLYLSQDLSHVDAGGYLDDLVRAVIESHGRTGMITATTEADDSRILIDSAIPLGLIVTELLSNTMQHGFPAAGGRPEAGHGAITICFGEHEAGELSLSYADDGAGLPPGWDREINAGIGIRTVIAIATGQLGGTIEFESGMGFACTIRFREANRYSKRV